jgi:hypothetical protein
MNKSRRNRVSALLTCTAGVVTAWSIHQHPEKLHAPAWVAYAMCLAFVVAGLIILVREASASSAYRWAVVSLLVLMAVPPAWIALGPGSRSCSVEFLSVAFLSPDIACRSVFFIGALTLVGMLVWAAREALTSKNAG